MLHYEFTFRSLTTAQSAQRILRSAGVDAELLRAPTSASAHGCGYAIRVANADSGYTARVLHAAGLYYTHSYRVGGAAAEEVSL